MSINKKKTIHEILALRCKTESIPRKDPKEFEVNSDFFQERATEYGNYEMEVFKYLYDDRASRNIKTVYALKNQLIDGKLLLIDDTIVPIEIKFRMNWPLACQTIRQFTGFCGRNENSFENGLVIFEKFNRDWAKKATGRSMQNGWIHWYKDYFETNGIKLQLVKLPKGGSDFEYCPEY